MKTSTARRPAEHEDLLARVAAAVGSHPGGTLRTLARAARLDHKTAADSLELLVESRVILARQDGDVERYHVRETLHDLAPLRRGAAAARGAALRHPVDRLTLACLVASHPAGGAHDIAAATKLSLDEVLTSLARLLDCGLVAPADSPVGAFAIPTERMRLRTAALLGKPSSVHRRGVWTRLLGVLRGPKPARARGRFTGA